MSNASSEISTPPATPCCRPLKRESWQTLIEVANIVISRSKDVCIIAPTGSGKSLLWTLPLLAVPSSISLVVTPYTTLGREGEERSRNMSLPAVFVNQDQHDEVTLEQVALGAYRIVFICPEMLEEPRFARVIYLKMFQSLLGGVYIDEAHLVHESLAWRESYERLGHLRHIIGDEIPFICISATLPKVYRHSLCTYAGLKSDYHFVNLGNHRPELATVVIPLKHEPGSFKDLLSVLPSTSSPVSDDIPKTIIYCDDVEMLMKLFWWLRSQLESMGLSPDLVDVLHASLTPEHEDKVMCDFDNDLIKILLGTKKIGAGLNFRAVVWVYQFLLRNKLSLVRFDQRCGRGARSQEMTAVGYLLYDPSILEKGYNDSIDPGILQLIKTDGCYEKVIDTWLENPPRPPPTTPRFCCSHCYPSLLPPQYHDFLMVNFDTTAPPSISLSKKQKDTLLEKLQEERVEIWRKEWESLFPGFGPRSLLCDADLERVVKHAESISTLDNVKQLTHIPYWETIGPWLFKTIQSLCDDICPERRDQGQSQEVPRALEAESKPSDTRKL
ncbi:hypothetical protein ABKN59_012046 [Abortiporus biennis]